MLRADGGSPVTSRPPIRMTPASAVSRPAISRSVVDLPQPEGPSSTLSVPGSKANVMPSTACTLPPAVVQCLLTRSRAIADMRECGIGLRSAEQRRQRRTRIGCAHERFADEERVHAGPAHLHDVALRHDAALGDDEPLGGNLRQQ